MDVNSSESNSNRATNTTGEGGSGNTVSFLAIHIPFYYKLTVALFGLVGNSITVYVMPRTKTPVTTRIIITTLAISDNGFLFCSLPGFVAPRIIHKAFALLYHATCKFHIFVIFFFQPISYWLVAILTIERLIVVAFPLKSKLITTKNTTLATVVVLVVFYLVFGSVVAYDYELVDIQDGATVVATVCTAKRYIKTFRVFGVFIDLGAPLVAILMGNVLICCLILHSRRNRSSLGGSQGSGRQAQETKLFITTFSVSLAFVILNTPFTLYWVAGKLILGKDVFLNYYNPYLLVSDCMSYTNFAVNFFLYVLFTKSFRDETKRIMKRWKCFRPKTSLDSSAADPDTKTMELSVTSSKL